jgi:hypothetical protein
MAQARRYKAYEDLYEILRRSHDDDVALVLRRIRSGEDVESVVSSIEEGDLLLQLSLHPEWRIRYDFPGRFGPIPPHLDGWPNPYLKSKLLGGSPFVSTDPENSTNQSTAETSAEDKVYAIPYHAAKIADPRLDQADPTQYTTVSTTKSVLLSLINIYLLHEYPWNSFFNADLFLDDMVRGRYQHCTGLLVNAVAAAAWVSSHSLTTRCNLLVSSHASAWLQSRKATCIFLDAGQPWIHVPC